MYTPHAPRPTPEVSSSTQPPTTAPPGLSAPSSAAPGSRTVKPGARVDDVMPPQVVTSLSCRRQDRLTGPLQVILRPDVCLNRAVRSLRPFPPSP
ncbi:hypothetical protein RRG08_032002 [Elysia crispata]|uniref:Uncharacterized protein n=1 Tax=Elysia crispata TaxID=231223 RepID=A0AAE1DRW7_9GAST|nr:hypothetical protein RRG08_032002 [Elysia crispata]